MYCFGLLDRVQTYEGMEKEDREGKPILKRENGGYVFSMWPAENSVVSKEYSDKNILWNLIYI